MFSPKETTVGPPMRSCFGPSRGFQDTSQQKQVVLKREDPTFTTWDVLNTIVKDKLPTSSAGQISSANSITNNETPCELPKKNPLVYIPLL